jgi:cell division protein FtsQ
MRREVNVKATRAMGRGIRGAAAFAVVAAIVAVAWWGYGAVLVQPIRHVAFRGDAPRLPKAELDALAQAIEASGSATLDSVREAARRVPWVRSATVRREFPDIVEITFEAHDAVAAWNEGQLVSGRGEVFTAEAAATLPQLRGPEGSAPAMLRELAALGAALAPLASPIAELTLTARGAWQVALQSGLVLDLGREELRARAERIAATWPQVASRIPEVRRVDLRYPNGFAITRMNPIPGPAKDARAKTR